ncbi:MAG: biotin--[acetyl-CoA-carboxylase] ligase [Kiritimatiellia bacterium]|nr:biotin--[acetyl-CoA-carboxylase] ligase [Lentisphaerota bacterium]
MTDSARLPPPEYCRGLFQVYRYASLPSTNSYLKKHHAKFPAGSVVWALEQTAGRGRFERQWLAEPGRDLCCSVLLPLRAVPVQGRRNIPQMAALAVCRVLEAHGLRPGLKWPNDVIVEDRKICGILCETAQSGERCDMVLGLGLNVNSRRREDQAPGQPAISLADATGADCDLRELLIELLDALGVCWDLFLARSFAGIFDQVRERLIGVGRRISLKLPDSAHAGVISGIAPDGALLFDCEQCGPLVVYSGDISLRGEC